ncbi:type II toxin-antitoxin system ParD family antitoxin [Aquirufa sp. ROCK-SH2]
MVFLEKTKIMAKNTSILLGEYFDNFIQTQIASGRFSSASEVIRTALRLFEKEENKKSDLIKELLIGEESGFILDVNREDYLKEMREKYLTNEIPIK